MSIGVDCWLIVADLACRTFSAVRHRHHPPHSAILLARHDVDAAFAG